MPRLVLRSFAWSILGRVSAALSVAALVRWSLQRLHAWIVRRLHEEIVAQRREEDQLFWREQRDRIVDEAARPEETPRWRVPANDFGSVGISSLWSVEKAARLEHGSAELRVLAAALEEHSMILFHKERFSPAVTPEQLRALYTKLHKARFPQVPIKLPPSRPNGTDPKRNLRGECFPGFPETNVLGCAESITNWHGLTGHLEPTAWWEKQHGQFHHDGGFSASAPPPPALVAMMCEETPPPTTGVPTTLKWEDGTTLECPPGSTLFYSTRVAMELATPEVAARARMMRCVYKEGFGRVREGEYPRMSKTMLTPLSKPSVGNGGETSSYRSITEFESFETLAFGAEGGDDGASEVYFQPLVQRDEREREFVVVHAVCLDHLEEWDGIELEWQPLSWEESQAFIEALLAPAARPPHLRLIEWLPGDVLFFDNLQMQHSVTPTDAYAGGGSFARRLMTRTAYQPKVMQVYMGSKVLARSLGTPRALLKRGGRHLLEGMYVDANR